MGRKIAVVIAIVLAALVLVFGIAGAYHAGYDHGIGSGAHVITRVGPGALWYPGYGRGFGFFPGFLLFPVVVLAVIALIAWRRPWHRHWMHGYGSGPGYGYGPGTGYGPGPGPGYGSSPGPGSDAAAGGSGGWSPGDPPPAFDEWHRRAHEAPPGGAPADPPPAETQEGGPADGPAA